MSDILAFTPPTHDWDSQYLETYHLGEVCGWLREQGYEADQRSLFVEARYLNRHRINEDIVDLSVFAEERLLPYLKEDRSDEAISREAHKLADILGIDAYDTIIIPLCDDQIVSVRDMRLLLALPILKERVREDQTVIIGGSNLADDHTNLVRLPYIDYAIDGDMEIPLRNILRHERKGESLRVDPGVITYREGEMQRGHPYQHPMNNKAKPYFNPDILEKDAKTSAIETPIIPYKLGRGCSQNCSFCSYFENQRFQYKSVDKAVTELRELSEETGVSRFRFADQNLFNDPEYMREFAVRVVEEGLDITWGGLAIIVAREQGFFDTLARSGCNVLYHGIESASNTVLHRMQKHQTREMIEATLRKERRAGIKPYAGFITDYVDETWEEYHETVDFVRQNPHLMGAEATSLRIFKSEQQPLYQNPEEHGIDIKEHEQEQDDWMGLVADFNLPFEDSRGDMGEAKARQRRIKEQYLERTADIELTLKNFARRHPLTFLRLQIRKLYKKPYTDIAHGYV